MASYEMEDNRSESRYIHITECSINLCNPFHECINGHLVNLTSRLCPTCNSSRLCPTCNSPVRLMIPCPNAQFSCPAAAFANGESSTHLVECEYTHCPYLFMRCDFTYSYRELFDHASVVHSNDLQMIKCGVTRVIFFANQHKLVLKESSRRGGEHIVLDRSTTPIGARFFVRCIALKVPEMRTFSWLLTLHSVNTLSFESYIINRVNNISGELPAVYFYVPSYMGSATDVLLCIDRVDIEEELRACVDHCD